MTPELQKLRLNNILSLNHEELSILIDIYDSCIHKLNNKYPIMRSWRNPPTPIEQKLVSLNLISILEDGGDVFIFNPKDKRGNYESNPPCTRLLFEALREKSK